jgi:hypothetical protein
MWVRHGTPVPKGWRIAEQDLTHHHDHAVLIEQINASE